MGAGREEEAELGLDDGTRRQAQAGAHAPEGAHEQGRLHFGFGLVCVLIGEAVPIAFSFRRLTMESTPLAILKSRAHYGHCPEGGVAEGLKEGQGEGELGHSEHWGGGGRFYIRQGFYIRSSVRVTTISGAQYLSVYLSIPSS